jgi:signal transduction histidine kinase
MTPRLVHGQSPSRRTGQRTDAPLLPTAPPVLPLAWSPWGGLACLALGFVAVGVTAAADHGLRAFEVMNAVLVTSWTVAGLFLVIHHPLRRLGLVVLVGATLAGASFTAATAVSHDWEGILGDVTALGLPLGLGLLPAAGFHIVAALPRGRLGTPARRVSVILAYAVGTAVGLAGYIGDPALPSWPLWVELAAAVAVAWPVAYRRYASSAGLDRQRLQWTMCAVVFVAEMALVIAALRLLVDWPPQALAVAVALTVAVPVSLATGTSSRLVAHIDRLLQYTVSSTALIGVVIATHVVVVLGLGLGREPSDTERRLLLLSAVAACVATGLYLRARRRLSEALNRVTYGERGAPDQVLRTFANRLTRRVPVQDLLLQLLESLRKTMVLTSAEIWRGSDGTLECSVSVPERQTTRLSLTAAEESIVARAGVSGPAWIKIWLPALLEGRAEGELQVAPVAYGGKLLGLIVVHRKADDDRLTERDKQVLGDVARQVGVALHNLALDSALQASLDEVRHQADELRASRARIVAAADAERRRIERNLHDGAQQHLVALAVNLRLARDLLEEDPVSAAAALDELAVNIKGTITELRNLAHGIYPPLLADSGLAQALRSAAARNPLDVQVQAENPRRYPAEVEAAVYFCCLEALQNVAKHAPGSDVTVRLWEETDILAFEVIDNGPGFTAENTHPGQGFMNMADRLGAIGGTVSWDSRLGAGTRVFGSVPLTN